ncbi:Cof-type HAD-IIB family hydrolase [Collinsella tanakaei]|uniref:Cof-type HAD-IIB family hydrolase n=1 Tax=Collinsella tanakaei TaxID=626935 RepID=UPI0025A4BCF8|nr:Cof-type HAD-IIB family hydrolase [Collinsella tanakaei]MDM8245605.1 Cof-type HAD-IIB family hydrolase [Collinsella tanakaei]
MYRLIASDMDETFLGEGHIVPPANVAALERLRELGVLFVPSSGRPYRSIMASLADIDPALLAGSYVISYNGGFINRYGDETPLLRTVMDRDVLRWLYDYAVERRICMHVYTESGRILTQFVNDVERSYIENLSDIEELPDDADAIGAAGGEEFPKIIFMDPDFSKMKALGAKLRPELDPALVDITYSSNRYVEFVPHDVNKGTGLAHLAELLGIDMADTIGIGDSENDLAMIQAAGLGVGVANVSDGTRPFCDMVLDTTADDGALPELLKRVIEPEHNAW